MANQLFEKLADDPRTNLRKLKKSPEGVERLVDAWLDLRNDLTADPEPVWTSEHLEQAANLTGLKSRHARGSRLGALSKGFWGDFSALGELDGNLDEEFRREWVQSQLIEKIDAEITALETHYQTLDFETIALDRAEAGARALFDVSKPAMLARRYEADARRGFFKALKEFRLVEFEFTARAEASPGQPSPAKSVGSDARMGSFRETPPPPDRHPSPAFPDTVSTYDPIVRGPEGQPVRPTRPDQMPN